MTDPSLGESIGLAFLYKFVIEQIAKPVVQARKKTTWNTWCDGLTIYGTSSVTGMPQQELRQLKLLINILKYCLLLIFIKSLWDSWVSIQKINEKTSIVSQIWIYTGGFIDLIFIGLWVYAFWLGKMQVTI